MKSFAAALVTILSLLCLPRTGTADDYALESAGAPPDALSAEIKQSLAADGYRVTGPEGELCDVWLAKSPAVKQDFKPDLRVKYPFLVGSFVGVLRVGENGQFTDFRDQVILPGVYTLRYGQQPQDGNHIGTSQQVDFLLALPAADDQSAANRDDKDELNTISAEAAGSSHPAILSLLPPEAAKPTQPELIHQPDHDFWVLQTTGEKRPPLRLVVVGIGVE